MELTVFDVYIFENSRNPDVDRYDLTKRPFGRNEGVSPKKH